MRNLFCAYLPLIEILFVKIVEVAVKKC